MPDTNDSEEKKTKVTLIKQPKKASIPAEAPVEPSDDDAHAAEKRKVVVVKKKVVAKKAPAKVVARHEAQKTDEVSAGNAPAAESPSPDRAGTRPTHEREDGHKAAAPGPVENERAISAPLDEKPAATEGPVHKVETVSATSAPEKPGAGASGAVWDVTVKGFATEHASEAARAAKKARETVDQRRTPARPETTSPQGYAGSRPAGSYGGPRPQGAPVQGQRSPGTYQGPRPQGAPGGGYQGGSGRPGGYQGGPGRPGGYQGGPGRPGGYQGGPGRPGGYQGGPGRPGGYQGGPGRPGGYQGGPGRPGGYQGRPGGPGRPGAPGTGTGVPAAGGKTAPKRFIKSKRPVYQRRDQEQTEKALQYKRKNDAPKANPVPKAVDMMETISVSDLAKKMNIKPSELIGKLMQLGVMATINQSIDSETATLLAAEYGCEVRVVSLYDETVIEKEVDNPDALVHRSPVVTVMGHVDHGKTKLLDAIRKTNVVASEFGGITQHIGAYMVDTGKGRVTFLDTPGHEAFTKMRARGSQITDIVVLVVAADDGVMPQTREAIDHAKAAEVPIIVAINKVDLPEANPDRVKTQLSEHGLVPEDWGGTTIFCEVSALQKKGIAELLDAILLQAEVLELSANYGCRAEGKVLESKIDHGRGIVASIIIQRGTLRVGDCFVAGVFPGKVRAMFDDLGQKLEEALPSMPVEVIGFEGMPLAGDPFEAVEDEKFARSISSKRQELRRFEDAKNVKKVTLDNLYDTIHEGAIQELKVIIKGDVGGSVEALKGVLTRLSTKEVKLNVLRAAAGAITEDDVMLASASDAIVIGFNVRPTAKAKTLADQEKVDIRKYNIIYRAEEEIRKAMEGMLAPEYKEVEIAKVEVRELFKIPKIGVIAGSFVLEGTVKRSAYVHVVRDSVELHTGKIASLRRFKDEAKEVAAGYECGIGIDGFEDLKVGDVLEVFENVQVTRTLTDNKNDRAATTKD